MNKIKSNFNVAGYPVPVKFLLLFSANKYMDIPYLVAYKTHPNFSRANQEKKTSPYIKHDEINIMNIINDNSFNLHYSLLNNDNRNMKVTLKSKLTGVAR